MTKRKFTKKKQIKTRKASELFKEIKLPAWKTKIDEIEIKIEKKGLDWFELSESLMTSPLAQRHFKGSRYRLLSAELIKPGEKELAISEKESVTYKITAYDYTRNRCVFIHLSNQEPLKIIESICQPEPSDDEFREAVDILLQRKESIAEGIRNKSVRIYKPMPPTVDIVLPSGEIERTLTVGIKSSNPGLKSEIVGVNMITGKLMHFKRGAPDGSDEDGDHCGVQDAYQTTTTKGVAGEAWVTILRGGIEIWKFLVIRPSASSGTKGSGIELKYVNYKKKRVLYQAHVPILNVRYDGDACGPYRDWQWEEGMFTANGNDPVPGFRVCNAPAQTILDSGTDTGNFRGVAIYVKGDEVVLVSEMQAGWYRYISEWRFSSNGSIHPRFGFSAVQNSCVCNIHHHHVYWRFDFDIKSPGNNLVEEFNDPILVGNSHWHKKLFEIRRQKDPTRKRKWRITHTPSGSAYEIIPGINDGVADDFGVGDLWVLRYHGSSEIDDGYAGTGGSADQCKAHIDKFLTGESVENQDVVIWYGAHFTHDINAAIGHIVGPSLHCVKW